MKVEKELKTKKRDLVKVPFKFDDAMGRAMRSRQPESGTTNEDYRRATAKRA